MRISVGAQGGGAAQVSGTRPPDSCPGSVQLLGIGATTAFKRRSASSTWREEAVKRDNGKPRNAHDAELGACAARYARAHTNQSAMSADMTLS